MSSLKRHEGYLMVDHRFSPGLPPEVARQAGYDPKHAGEGKLFEAASLTCSHCKTAYVKNPLRTRERAYCAKCDHYICDHCDTIRHQPEYVHATFEKVVHEAYERSVKAPALGSPNILLLPTT
jgi:hypothetical protein